MSFYMDSYRKELRSLEDSQCIAFLDRALSEREGNEVPCASVAEWIFLARNAGRNGQLMLSEDDPKRRLLGFRNLDTSEHYLIGLDAVKKTDWNDPPLVESWESVQMSIDMPEVRIREYVETPGGRATLSERLSGRKPSDKEIAKVVRDLLGRTSQVLNHTPITHRKLVGFTPIRDSIETFDALYESYLKGSVRTETILNLLYPPRSNQR
jgi:hypothetical protein